MLLFFFSCNPIKQTPITSPSKTVDNPNHLVISSPRPHFAVKGRQGVAAMENRYYVSGSTSLHTYDTSGNHILSNNTPFQTYTIPSNHIGDIEAHNEELYIAAEWFEDGVGKDIQIAIHDAKTLQWKRSFPFAPESGQLEVSGITVDASRNRVWLCSWVGGDSGRHLYSYDLTTGEYKEKLKLSQEIQWIQGIEYHDNSFYITADDGDAEKREPDHIYLVSMEGEVSIFRTLTDLNDVGEIEGLSVDTQKGILLVHANRGKRIVKGMPKGFYPGYNKEIHEVYTYPLIKD